MFIFCKMKDILGSKLSFIVAVSVSFLVFLVDGSGSVWIVFFFFGAKGSGLRCVGKARYSFLLLPKPSTDAKHFKSAVHLAKLSAIPLLSGLVGNGLNVGISYIAILFKKENY